MKKYLIFDSGPLINFAMNGLLPVLEKLKKDFDGDFLITKEVKSEIIDYPSTIKKYELESLQLENLLKKEIIKLGDLTEKQINELRIKRENLMNIANNTFFSNNKSIHLLDKGECAALALYQILEGEKLLVIDERTTRMLCENPENLKKLLEKKLHSKISANKKNYNFFKDFKIIRSTELAFIANKKGFIEIEDSRILDALLYALKIRGCSISEEEIEEIKKLN